MVVYEPIPTPIYISLWVSTIVYAPLAIMYLFFGDVVGSLNPPWCTQNGWTRMMSGMWKSGFGVALAVLAYTCIDPLIRGSIDQSEIEIELIGARKPPRPIPVLRMTACAPCDCLDSRLPVLRRGDQIDDADAARDHRAPHQARVLAHRAALAHLRQPRQVARPLFRRIISALCLRARGGKALLCAVYKGAAAGGGAAGGRGGYAPKDEQDIGVWRDQGPNRGDPEGDGLRRARLLR